VMSQSTPNPEALPYSKIIRSCVAPYPTSMVSTASRAGPASGVPVAAVRALALACFSPALGRDHG
jgi:hypothetical protein